MTVSNEDRPLWVESTRGPDDEPVCLFTWGVFQWYAPVAAVRAAALDLVTCAAYAEMMMILAVKLKLDGHVASAFATDLLRETGRHKLGNAEIVDLIPAGSTKSREAVVLIQRGSEQGLVSTTTARKMSLQWLEAAEATESDQLVAEALRGTGYALAEESMFSYLRELRQRKAPALRGKPSSAAMASRAESERSRSSSRASGNSGVTRCSPRHHAEASVPGAERYRHRQPGADRPDSGSGWAANRHRAFWCRAGAAGAEPAARPAETRTRRNEGLTMTAPELAGTILLSGIVGSTAYGLATVDSDVDRLGTFAAPTALLLGLSRPDESITTTNPDVTFHEAGKLTSLLLKCNPTVTELLWLPEELYEERTPLGDELISVRQLFLSRKYMRDAYLGYACQQFRRLRDRGDGSFSADTRKRTAKHARHLARLVRQGIELYETGHLTVKLEFPEWFREFGERVAAGDLEAAEYELAAAEVRFGEITSPLPEQPDMAAAEEWLLRVRREFWDGGDDRG